MEAVTDEIGSGRRASQKVCVLVHGHEFAPPEVTPTRSRRVHQAPPDSQIGVFPHSPPVPGTPPADRGSKSNLVYCC